MRGAAAPRPEGFDAFARETIENPYPFYRAMREHAPVFRPKGSDWWYVSRYEDVKTVSRDTETYSSNIVAILLTGSEGRLLRVPDLPGLPVDVLAIADPPSHGVHRKVSTAGLGRSFPRNHEAWMAAQVSEMLDRALPEGSFDWMDAVAFQLPMKVALHLLELDTREHRRAKKLSDDSIDLLAGTTNAWRMAKGTVGAFRLYRWCVRAFQRARRDRPEGLMGALVEAVEAGRISAREASSLVLQVIIAGSDSSASLMGSAVALLATRPDLQEQLRASPELIPVFIEEAIRLEAPFQGHFRQTTRACELGGVSLPAGARLFVSWASANRDEARFDQPDEVNLQRPKPKAHLSFGHGIHLCIGAALGRMEARLAITELLERTRSFSLDCDALEHRPSVFVRTLVSCPIRVEPR